VKDVYYVYHHAHPETGDVVYVGHGRGYRAWAYGSTHRSEDHNVWCFEQEQRGYTPDDWVLIYRVCLSKEEACKIEREAIDKISPKFNKKQGEKVMKMTPELLEQAVVLRASGMSYSEIANSIDLSTMTIYRAVNGQTKNLGGALEKQSI